MLSQSKLLKDKYPEIYQQIHPTKNEGIEIEKLTIGSGKRIWWNCNSKKNKCKHHTWFVSVGSRLRKNTGCPYCKGKKTCTCNSLKEKHPKLMKEWNKEENDKRNLNPECLVEGSTKIAAWNCRKSECDHHKWDAIIRDRVKRGDGCPYCSYHRICPCDSLKEKHPKLMKEWDEKRNKIDPSELAPGSNKKVYWICAKNKNCNHHKWAISPYHRVIGKTGCPFCARKRTCPCDSFMKLFPNLEIEFDKTKNIDIDPFTISPGSKKKIWWSCRTCNQSWKAALHNRTKKIPTNCPSCRKSVLEETFSKIIVQLDQNGISFDYQIEYDKCVNYKTGRNLKFDFLVKGFYWEVLVELDGVQHFEDVYFDGKTSDLKGVQERDRIKYRFCKKNRKHLIRISYSEIDNMEKHLIYAIDLIREIGDEAVNPVTLFFGEEYQELLETVYKGETSYSIHTNYS